MTWDIISDGSPNQVRRVDITCINQIGETTVCTVYTPSVVKKNKVPNGCKSFYWDNFIVLFVQSWNTICVQPEIQVFWELVLALITGYPVFTYQPYSHKDNKTNWFRVTIRHTLMSLISFDNKTNWCLVTTRPTLMLFNNKPHIDVYWQQDTHWCQCQQKTHWCHLTTRPTLMSFDNKTHTDVQWQQDMYWYQVTRQSCVVSYCEQVANLFSHLRGMENSLADCLSCHCSLYAVMSSVDRLLVMLCFHSNVLGRISACHVISLHGVANSVRPLLVMLFVFMEWRAW